MNQIEEQLKLLSQSDQIKVRRLLERYQNLVTFDHIKFKEIHDSVYELDLVFSYKEVFFNIYLNYLNQMVWGEMLVTGANAPKAERVSFQYLKCKAEVFNTGEVPKEISQLSLEEEKCHHLMVKIIEHIEVLSAEAKERQNAILLSVVKQREFPLLQELSNKYVNVASRDAVIVTIYDLSPEQIKDLIEYVNRLHEEAVK